MRSVFTRLIAALAIAASCAAGWAQPVQRWFFASDFGQWRIQGQQANVFQWSPGSLCLTAAVGSSSQFFPFNTNAPVLIADVTPSQSEVLTPSAVTNTNTYCSITISAVNQHYSFSAQSGTGGLQEVLNTISSSNAYPAVVILDRNWYQLANAVPGTTPQAIIGAATGNSAVTLIDNTTVPQTQFGWNGTKWIKLGITGNHFNQLQSSNTNIAAPTALTTVAATCATNGGGCITTSTTGGSIPATSAYTLGATCVDASGGETTLSTDTASGATVTTGSTATNTISVTSPAGCTAANGAVGWRLYMTAASGATLTEILYSPVSSTSFQYPLQFVLTPATVLPIGSTATISAIITGTATIPLVNTAFPRTGVESAAYPPGPAGGTIASAATGTIYTINLPAGHFNTLGRSVNYCGEANVTTNGTTGTLTFKVLLASLVGTTSITPFTVTSGTTTASADVPINFCVKFTTAKVGTTGNLWVSGCANFVLNPAANQTGTVACSTPVAVSSNVDLTKQDQLQFDFTPTTTGSTAFQMTQLDEILSN